MSKIYTVYFIVNTNESGEKQFGLFNMQTVPVQGIKPTDEVLNFQEEYDVRDEIVKNILDFSKTYRNIKNN